MDDWKEALPEPLREAPYFKAADSLEAAIEGINDAAQWQGNSLRIPSVDATPEQTLEFVNRAVEKIPGLMPVPGEENLDQVFGKLGKPEEAGNYKLPEIDEESGVTFSQEDVDAMRSWAHEQNMTQAQFEAFVNLNVNRISDAGRAADGAMASEVAHLQTEWGSAYSQRVKEVAAFLRADPDHPEELVAAVEDGRVPAKQMLWLYKISQEMLEEGSTTHHQDGTEKIMTPAEAQITLDELTGQLIGMPQTDPRYGELNRKRVEAAKIVDQAQQDAADRRVAQYGRAL